MRPTRCRCAIPTVPRAPLDEARCPYQSMTCQHQKRRRHHSRPENRPLVQRALTPIFEARKVAQPGLQKKSRNRQPRCNRLHLLMLGNGMGEVKPRVNQRPAGSLLLNRGATQKLQLDGIVDNSCHRNWQNVPRKVARSYGKVRRAVLNETRQSVERRLLAQLEA